MRRYNCLEIAIVSFFATSMSLSDAFAAAPIGRFIDVKPVAGINLHASTGEDSPVISADGLELFFDSSFVGPSSDLWVAKRVSRNDPFQTPTLVQGSVNTGADEDPGSISSDGLTFYFGRTTGGSYDLYQATRPDRQSPFGNVTSLGSGVNTNLRDNYPFVSPDGLALYYHHGNHRLWTASRASTVDSFTNAQDLGDVVNGLPPLNSWRPTVSTDGLTLFFSDGYGVPPRPGGKGDADIWVAFRETTTQPFGVPVNLNNAWPGSNVNSVTYDAQAYISPDWPAVGSKLYFTTARSSVTGDIWEATWVPEPSTFVLSLIACALPIAVRRSRRGNL
jgi:hypothetical protein